jgi:predicted transcriptional regulator
MATTSNPKQVRLMARALKMLVEFNRPLSVDEASRILSRFASVQEISVRAVMNKLVETGWASRTLSSTPFEKDVFIYKAEPPGIRTYKTWAAHPPLWWTEGNNG